MKYLFIIANYAKYSSLHKIEKKVKRYKYFSPYKTTENYKLQVIFIYTEITFVYIMIVKLGIFSRYNVFCISFINPNSM